MASKATVAIRPLHVASVLQKQLLITLLVLSGPISFALGSGEADGNAKNGEKLFLGEFPGVQGNGRSCATCHVPADAFGLTPAHAEDRWQKLQQARATNPKADDPLFRSIDADDFDQDFTRLRKHALVRVIIRLPRDADGNKLVWPLDDPDADEVKLFRATPGVRNVALTAPYQYDGRFATLQEQASGALVVHAEIQHNPNPRFLDDVAAFQKTQFSSVGVKALAAALANGQPPPDPDPPLNDLETLGKALFQHHCTPCHGGPKQTTPIPGFELLQDIFVSRPPPPFADGLPFPDAPPLPVRLWAIRIPGQSDPLVLPSTDPGKLLISGRAEDFNQFEVPALFGVGKTAPYFHDNRAATLEDVLLHYQSFFIAIRRIVPPEVPFPDRPDELLPEEIAPIVAYLKKL
jgi:cytochrome c peroxidase